jgi:CRISPR-associated endonuclease/helicase Cas3
MPIPRYAAHSPGYEQPDWEDQRTHRERVVAALSPGGPHPGLSRLQALVHDLGKYMPEFQTYIRASHAGESASGSPHALHGALIAALIAGQEGWPGSAAPLVAAPLLAHHTGLHDHDAFRKALQAPGAEAAAKQALRVALSDGHPSVGELRALLESVPGIDLEDPFQVDLAVRMLLSLPVDADWTATEQHYRPTRAAARSSVSVLDAAARFEPGRTRFLTAQDARRAAPPSPEVRRVRAEVHQACMQAGRMAAGSDQRLYRLTVPTGGGKTLSVMAFALTLAQERAARFPQAVPVSRVVMAVPLTSITDQNAAVLRSVLGADAVLEHHSALDARVREDAPLHVRLAADTWDAPVIVTTTVQALEVFGAAEPRRLRRLHRLRGSVLILDEVQAIPLHVLAPAVALLREATQRHDLTVVLCSATQPPFELEERLSLGDVREINPAFPAHFHALRRVTYHWTGTLDQSELAVRIRGREQVLAVLNTRREAVSLLRALGDDPGHFHLSTLMCGAHRTECRAQMDTRLRRGARVRLISTTVIEAGVEISFPATYRQTAGLERVIQVAGRTNRDGEGQGDVHLFDLQGGFDGAEGYGVATRQARRQLLHLAQTPETFSDALHDPQTLHRYFHNLLHDPALNLDRNGVQEQRRALNLRAVSDRFRLMDDEQVAVLVPWGRAGERLIAAVRRKLARGDVLERGDRARLQPFVVQIRPKDAERLHLELLQDGLYVCHPDDYDPVYGLRLYDDPQTKGSP